MTDWHRLSIRTDDGVEVEALGWWIGYGGSWALDRVVDGEAFAYGHGVTDLGPADVLVLPAPSGPVVRKPWGWLCGDTEVENLADADGWVAELPQHIADSRAIAAHIRALGEAVEVPETQVWLDPQPVVPRPEPNVPTLAKDVGRIEILVEGEPAALVALGRAIAAALAGEVK